MKLRISETTPVPPFEQIRAQVALAVAAGRMRPGDRLPTIRELATQLDLAPATVARAYRELTSAGIVETAGRRGTFVATAPPVAHDISQRAETLAAAADTYAEVLLTLGADIGEAFEALIGSMRARALVA